MYKLFVDDEREPKNAGWPDDHTWVVVRSSTHAIVTVKNFGMPEFMSLDHDLGGADTVMNFLRWLADEHYDDGPPEYKVHSQNNQGVPNIIAYLDSWKRAVS